MKEVLIRRLEYDFSCLLNEVFSVYEEFYDDKIHIHNVTALLHGVVRLWGVCAEAAFKILLLNNGENIEQRSKKGSLKTMSCQKAFERCLHLKLIEASPDAINTTLKLIQLRNMSQSYSSFSLQPC